MSTPSQSTASQLEVFLGGNMVQVNKFAQKERERREELDDLFDREVNRGADMHQFECEGANPRVQTGDLLDLPSFSTENPTIQEDFNHWVKDPYEVVSEVFHLRRLMLRHEQMRRKSLSSLQDKNVQQIRPLPRSQSLDLSNRTQPVGREDSSRLQGPAGHSASASAHVSNSSSLSKSASSSATGSKSVPKSGLPPKQATTPMPSGGIGMSFFGAGQAEDGVEDQSHLSPINPSSSPVADHGFELNSSPSSSEGAGGDGSSVVGGGMKTTSPSQVSSASSEDENKNEMSFSKNEEHPFSLSSSLSTKPVTSAPQKRSSSLMAHLKQKVVDWKKKFFHPSTPSALRTLSRRTASDHEDTEWPDAEQLTPSQEEAIVTQNLKDVGLF